MADLATRFGSWKEKAMRAASAARTIRAKAARPVEIAVTSAEIQGAAFMTGLWKGRVGDPELWGAPVDLLVGLGTIAVGIVMDPKLGDHLVPLGNGVTAAYTSQAGYGIGLEMAAKANHTNVRTIIDRRGSGQLDNGQPDPDAPQRQLP